MKRKGKTPRFKRQRKLMTELPGMGRPGALERRPYPPGEHGQKRRKYSEYGLQLEEKQKILFNYGLRESQLRRFVKEAKRTAADAWVPQLVSLLERRLDNIVFRLGFAPSIPGAKQLVSHGKVLVNGRRVDIRSVVVRVGDEISLKPAAYVNQVYLQSKDSPRLPLPNYLTKNAGPNGDVGKLSDLPTLGDLPFAFNEGLFTSYYSLKG